LTKSGGGTLALRAANTFAGAVTVNEGTLDIDGSVGAGNGVIVNSGATLTGDGSINRNVVLNSGSTLHPGSTTTGSSLTSASLLWNGDAAFAFELGSTSNQLTLNGALSKGGAGLYNFAFTPAAGLAAGNIYTLATFSSTDFTVADLTFSGLPAGLTGVFTVNANSIQFEIFGPPEIATQPQSVSVPMGGTGTFSVTVNPSPPLTYQWFKDGNAINGATGASLTIANVEAVDIGSYTVTITNAAGTTMSNPATLSIAPLALSRHAPALNSAVLTGSLQQMLSGNVTLNGTTAVSGDLLVPGTPNVIINGAPNYGGTVDGSGSDTPTNYNVTLNNGTTLGHVVRRTDPLPLPTVNAPDPPAGNRNVTINNPNQSVGDWATVLNLTLNSNAGLFSVPPGAYGSFTANGGSGFVLGVPGSTIPTVYSFQRFTLNGGAPIQVVGPVLVMVGSSFNVNGGTVGNSTSPAWLTLNVFSGGLTLNSGARVYGYVTLPGGTLTINGNSQVTGGVAVDGLTINSNGKLVLLN
jgi:autotransporter-associated beta strand protein